MSVSRSRSPVNVIKTDHRKGVGRDPVLGQAEATCAPVTPAPSSPPGPGPWLDKIFSALGMRSPSNGIVRTSVPVNAPWLGGVENAQELSGLQAQTLEGTLPPGVRGTLLRNGPGRFERGGERVPHWFDGDGGILRVKLDGSIANAEVDYRFVRTPGFVEEAAAGRYTRPVFGYLPEGTPAARSVAAAKNTANTNIMAFGQRLLALYEGALPTALNPETLATVGEIDLGALVPGEFFTAHPHRDADGRTFALSTKPGKGASVLELDENGCITRKVSLPALKTMPHDFISAGPYLVFIESPVRMNLFPALLGMVPIADALSWKEHGQNRIHVVNKDTLETKSESTAAPFSSAHFGGGRLEPDGTISFIAFVPESNDPSGRALMRFMRGEHVDVGGRPTRIHLDPNSGEIVRKVILADVRADWPVEDPRTGGKSGEELWCATHSDGAGYFDGYGRLDRDTGLVDRAQLPPGTYGNEPTLCVDADDPSKLWLITVQYVSGADRSELAVYDAHALHAGPVYRAALPSVIPFGFHGCFVPAL